jgi:hypothetical protein
MVNCDDVLKCGTRTFSKYVPRYILFLTGPNIHLVKMQIHYSTAIKYKCHTTHTQKLFLQVTKKVSHKTVLSEADQCSKCAVICR